MHLQQTKKGSRRSGGAQYYLHAIGDGIIKDYLRRKGAVPVALVTPYGATKSDFVAVSTDRTLRDEKPVPGRVAHDRIQGGGRESIGEAIRRWYQLPRGDFDAIEIAIDPRDDVFYLTPLTYSYSGQSRRRNMPRFRMPLSFTDEFQSVLWRDQISKIHRTDPKQLNWAFEEICRVMADHRKESKMSSVDEIDLLRAGGALSLLGMRLGPYVKRGFDCDTEFQFLNYPPYRVPVEIKRNSVGFKYQQNRYGRDELSRAVVLCAKHGHKTIPDHIDVIELEALCRYGNKFA